jgi:hypothetical protein
MHEQSTLFALCACGCGELVTHRDAHGNLNRFLHGHNARRRGGWKWANKRPLAERFWMRVQQSPEPDGCWEWMGAHLPSGYGVLWDGEKLARTNRIAWELASGAPLANDAMILHTCDNPRCVRNDPPGVYIVNGIELPRYGHLALGTQRDNSLDKLAKGRGNDAKRLTAADVQAIRAAYVPVPGAQPALAAQYGVSPSTIGDVVNRRTWKHL